MQKIKIVLAISIIIIVTSACSAATSTPIINTPTVVVAIEPTQTQSISTATPTQTPSQASLPQSADDVVRVSLVEAKRAFDNQSALFIDARSQQAYYASHIKGAIYIGDFESDPKLNANKDQWIITYCT